MITDHKFRNKCGFDCRMCRRDVLNKCSAYIGLDNFVECGKTRDEHAGVEDWSTPIV